MGSGAAAAVPVSWRGLWSCLRTFPFVALVLAVPARATPSAAPQETVALRLNAGVVDTSDASTPLETLPAPPGRRLHLVQLAGPTRPEWLDAVRSTGAQVVAYVPDWTYLVYADAPALERIAALVGKTGIRWQGPYRDAYKVPSPADPESGTVLRGVQMVWDPAANRGTLDLIERLRSGPWRVRYRVLDYQNVVVPLTREAAREVAARPDVVYVETVAEPVLHDERQAQILAGNLSGTLLSGPGYLAWLAGRGFTPEQFAASGFVVDVTDSGIDNGTTSPAHFGLYEGGATTNASRLAYTRLEGTPNPGSTLQGCDGHGTLNAHVLAGYDDASDPPFADSMGFRFGLGVCPFVRLGSSVVFDPTSWTHPGFPDLLARAYRDGARISTNSWGYAGNGTYDMSAQAYDALVRDAQPSASAVPAPGNQEMVVLFSAGNRGPSAASVGSPGTAKNVLTVGAAENVQPFGGADGCSITDAQADGADDVAVFSSRGPCGDGRHKPDLVAPGTHVSGGVFQVPSPPANGRADLCFTGTGVCGGPDFGLFWPPDGEWYTASSGTSHACPAVAGGAALLRQRFLNDARTPPSPAMTRAYLLNSARYLTGVGANDSLWSDSQGMGEMDLGTAFDGAPRLLRDQVATDTFTETGQARTFTGTVADPSRPFRVTVAWSDAPGSVVSPVALVNDIDLEVTVGTEVYRGNVFAGPYATTGGTADSRNNVESVFLPLGVSGPFAVTVSASNIAGDGVPGSGETLDQDFALVVYNAVEAEIPVIAAAGATLQSESCGGSNGAVDPGETVTIAFALENVGLLDTGDVVATLEPSGGIVPITRDQDYGTLTAGGAPASRPFAFLAHGPCGGTATATLLVRDGSTDLGTVRLPLHLGAPEGCCLGTGPKPVPDGYWVPGAPVTASRVDPDGGVVRVSWDVTGCSASSYDVYTGPLASLSTYSYDRSTCGLAASGVADVVVGSGDVFFVVVPVDGTTEGSHGRDSSGSERAGTGVGMCTVLAKDATGVCP